VTERKQPPSAVGPEVTAATSATLDLELACQLRELIAADADSQASEGANTMALVEAGVWALAAIGAWILVARLV
jgi:hypothetical protein